MDWEQSKLWLSVSQADVLCMILQYYFVLQNELGGKISQSHDAQDRVVKKIDFMKVKCRCRVIKLCNRYCMNNLCVFCGCDCVYVCVYIRVCLCVYGQVGVNLRP